MKRWLVAEALLLTLLAAASGAALAWQAGHWGWSWDALNHHVYLGLTAEHPRWHLDVLAANYQAYVYPYLYWPTYRISLIEGDGLKVLMLWSAAQSAMLLPPIWLAAYRLLSPSNMAPWELPLARGAACALAYSSAIVLLAVTMSSNDLLATMPLLWALALHLGQPQSGRRAFTCAALWGVSTAFKWSNGLMLPVLFFWWWQASTPHFPLRRGVAITIGAAVGFGVAYLPWGIQLWQVTGNPFYPYFQALFGGH